MSSPFAPLSSASAWLKPAEVNGHLLVIANVVFVKTEFDQMRNGNVDIYKFDVADLNAGAGWETGVQSNHPGITNKLQNLAGRPALGRIGQVQTKGGFLAWTLAEPTEQDVAAATQWLAANPVPAVANPFAPVTAPAPAAVQAFAAGTPAPVAAPVAAAAPAGPAQNDVAALLAQLQAKTGA